MDILNTCSKYLKKGGSLVYSTCSILKEENEDIVNKFVEENTDFSIQDIQFNTKKEQEFFEKFLKQNKFLQVYQNEKTDGFFICKMLKNS